MDSSFNNPQGEGGPTSTPTAEGDLSAEARSANSDLSAEARSANSDLSAEARSAKAEAKTPATPAVPASPAEARFQSCRWRKPLENGTPDHCTHRDVLPMAGTAGFQPDSWCGDCSYFKAKRSPRKRPEQQQNDNWRW